MTMKTTGQLVDELEKTASDLEALAANSKVAGLDYGSASLEGSDALTLGGAYIQAMAAQLGVID